MPKTRVWESPTVKGNYDIIVDVDCDGTFNAGDKVGGKSKNPGFKVREFFR